LDFSKRIKIKSKGPKKKKLFDVFGFLTLLHLPTTDYCFSAGLTCFA